MADYKLLEDAAAVLDEYEAAKAAAADARRKLALAESRAVEYVRDHGPIETPEGRWYAAPERTTVVSDETALVLRMARYLRLLDDKEAAKSLLNWFAFTPSKHPCRIGEVEKSLGQSDLFVSHQKTGEDGEPVIRFKFLANNVRRARRRKD